MMLFVNQSQTNSSDGLQYQGLVEKVMLSTLIILSCCVFLFINGIMLFTLRSKQVFRETSRYILLFNLLCADTMQMALSQLLYLLAMSRIRLTYPVCGVLAMLADLTNVISPLTLVAMSLERYVAVCFPLRHTAIITMRNTSVAVAAVWAFSSLNILIRVILLLDFPFEDLESLQMNDFCSAISMFLGTMSGVYDAVYTYVLFLSASVAVTCTYIGVMIAARSASTDKASTRKTRNTLLLHLVQLGLSLSSTIYNPILIALYRIVTRLVFVRVQSVLYVCIFLLPRCLSSLIYGIRDQTIRLVLINYLCCHWRRSRLL